MSVVGLYIMYVWCWKDGQISCFELFRDVFQNILAATACNKHDYTLIEREMTIDCISAADCWQTCDYGSFWNADGITTY